MSGSMPLQQGLECCVKRRVITVGQFGSASTWTFNVTASILGAAEPESRVRQRYADKLHAIAGEHLASEMDLVIKSHTPDASIRNLAQSGQFPTILTLRNPIDAVASLISRFNEPFETALSSIAATAECLVLLSTCPDILILRYEDKFVDNPATIPSICRWLGADISGELQTAIGRIYARDEQRRRLLRFQAQSTASDTLGNKSRKLQANGQAHHVAPNGSDWRAVLSFAQARQIVERTLGFCETFDYMDHGLPLSIGDLGRDAGYIDQRFGHLRDQFLQSASWRITRPLRSLGAALRRSSISA